MICVLRTAEEAAAGGRSEDWCGCVGNMVWWLIEYSFVGIGGWFGGCDVGIEVAMITDDNAISLYLVGCNTSYVNSLH